MEIRNRKLKIKRSLPRGAKRSGGFGLVEVVVAVSIAAFSIVVVWQVYALFLGLSLSNSSLFQASFLAEEGIEAVKFMRDESWTTNIATLSEDVPYTLVFTGTAWETTTAPALIDGQFDRKVVLTGVERDASGDITSSGSPDSNTKKVTVTVSWVKDNATSTKEITTYVTNLFNN